MALPKRKKLDEARVWRDVHRKMRAAVIDVQPDNQAALQDLFERVQRDAGIRKPLPLHPADVTGYGSLALALRYAKQQRPKVDAPRFKVNKRAARRRAERIEARMEKTLPTMAALGLKPKGSALGLKPKGKLVLNTTD